VQLPRLLHRSLTVPVGFCSEPCWPYHQAAAERGWSAWHHRHLSRVPAVVTSPACGGCWAWPTALLGSAVAWLTKSAYGNADGGLCRLVGLATVLLTSCSPASSPAAARSLLSWRRSCTGSPCWLTGLTAGAFGMARSYFLHPALWALPATASSGALRDRRLRCKAAMTVPEPPADSVRGRLGTSSHQFDSADVREGHRGPPPWRRRGAARTASTRKDHARTHDRGGRPTGT